MSLSGAQTFLTIDATNDRLIRVDQNTGSVANVGPLGIDVSAGIPVRFNGDLVVLSVGGAAGFAVIDEATGALPSLTPFSMPGSTIQTVEGIASDLSGLLISLDIDPTNSTFSNTIARLDPSTGSLTEVITIPLDVLPNGVDIDGMAYDPVFGDLLAVDAAGDIEATVFFRVSIPNGLVTPLFELPFDGLGGAVISPFIEGDSLWVTAVAPGQMPLTPSRLIRFDRDGDSWARAESREIAAGNVRCFGLARSVPCNVADLASPLGVLDLQDIDAFVAAFTAGDAAGDLAEPFGALDVSDIDAFIAAFTAGCP